MMVNATFQVGIIPYGGPQGGGGGGGHVLRIPCLLMMLHAWQVDCSPTCDPEILSIFVGDGPGDHKYHEFPIGDGTQVRGRRREGGAGGGGGTAAGGGGGGDY